MTRGRVFMQIKGSFQLEWTLVHSETSASIFKYWTMRVGVSQALSCGISLSIKRVTAIGPEGLCS